ncbi:MAG: hypothetical protein WD070_03220 [Pirellulaceae bacterium]
MNGIGLLVALAAVGVDVGWESTSSGKLAYTIRIESVLVDKLRDGSAIESVVEKTDRGLRKFRVAVGPKNQQTERTTAATANEVDYGWRGNESGGIDYYVQISLERLETLSRGIPLDCEVHPDVPEIEKIYVFVGDTKLPRELPPRANPGATPPRDQSTIGDSRGGNIAPVSGTEGNSARPRYGDSNYGTQNNSQATSDANRNNSYTQTPHGNFDNNQGYGPQPPYDARNQPASSGNRYGQYGDNTLPVPQLDDNRSPAYDRSRDANYDDNRNPYPPRQETVGRQPAPAQPAYTTQVAQNTGPPATSQQPQYDPQQPQAPAANSQVPQYPPWMMNPAAFGLVAQQTPNVPAAAQPASEPATTPQPKEEKTSKPLLLTTFALFASIGANAYLGWLAWSFFWRFRDAASDLSRARSNAFPASSIAGH